MRFGIVLIAGLVMMSIFAVPVAAVSSELQFPLVLFGGLASGLVVGGLVKNLRRGVLGGFLSGFSGGTIGGVIGFLLIFPSRAGASGLGLVFWAVLGLIWSGAVGLLSGVVGAVGGSVGAFIMKKRTRQKIYV